MSYKFDDYIEDNKPEEDDFYDAGSQMTHELAVYQSDMPDGLFKTGWQYKDVILSYDSLCDDAMKQVVARTCTAYFHRRKGYLDSDENSTMTLYELEKLFEIPEQTEPDCINLNHTFRNKFTTEINYNILNKGMDAIFETDDFFIYITHESGENFKLDSSGWHTPLPTHKPFVCYILSKEESERWAEENQYLEYASTMMERFSLKPILVFHAKKEIERGKHIFMAMDVYKALIQKTVESPVLLEFKGLYSAGNFDENGIRILYKTENRYNLKL